MKLSMLKLYLSELINIVNRNKKDDIFRENVYVFHVIDYYFKSKKNSNLDNCISDKTIEDIDFHEVFKFIDYTKSKIGQQFLFNRILTINYNEDFEKQEKLIDFISRNPEIRANIEKILYRLNKKESYGISNLFIDNYIAKPKHFNALKLLAFIPLVSLLLAMISNYFYLLLAISIVINLILHYKYKKYIYLYKDSIPQLLILYKCAKDIYALDLPFSKNKFLLYSMKSIEEIRKRMFVFEIEKVGDSDLFDIFFVIIEYVKIFFLLEPLMVFSVLDKLNSKKDDIENLFNYIGELDSYISIFYMRENAHYYCVPNVSKKSVEFKFVDMYHPLIINCIPNTLNIEGKSVLLTGSNMAGKTTFIRSVAINTLLAQTLNTCYAKVFKLYPMRLFSAIRISDDLLNDKSYYFEEVLTIKQMIDESVKLIGNLFLLDEIFKGTNTIERISAGKAVLSYLTKSENNIVFVSTHDVELADLLIDTYGLYHFTEVIKDNNIYFDYKLKKGNLATRNAIRILEINNYPKEIIDEAKRASYFLNNNNN